MMNENKKMRELAGLNEVNDLGKTIKYAEDIINLFEDFEDSTNGLFEDMIQDWVGATQENTVKGFIKQLENVTKILSRMERFK